MTATSNELRSDGPSRNGVEPGRHRTRRLIRSAAATLAVLAAAALLSGCTKPQPTVTVFSGSDSKAVAAQAPCVILGSCAEDVGKYAHITVRGGSQILLDAPRDLANAGWIVTAYIRDTAGKNTPLTSPQGVSTTSVIKDLVARVQVPQATSGSYFLQVSSVKPSNQLTTWIVNVELTA